MKGYIQSSEEEIYFDIQEFCNYIFTFLTKNINVWYSKRQHFIYDQ
jgi:hypothetical protein